MKTKHKNIKIDLPNWLISSLLYGLSWSVIFNVSLSFLAWFAFIPLFISLEKKNTFWSFYKPALLFSILSYLIICHGFLFTPKKQIFFLLGAISELLMSSVAFALLYPFKKKFGFKKALILFPFIIALWEWIYQWLDHTTGYLMLSHSQTRYTWIIQFIDLFGVWSIATWTMGFNVLLYFQIKNLNGRRADLGFFKRMVLVCGIMIFPPLFYAGFRYSNFKKRDKEKINITLIHTNFDFSYEGSDRYVEKIERLTNITDSADYEFKRQGVKTDLYVWHEGAVDYGNDEDFYNFIETAVHDWKTPLLTGMRVIPFDTTHTDHRFVNRATLIQDSVKRNKYQYYDKVHLASFTEKIPYHSILQYIPGFPPLNDNNWFKAGREIKLINLQNRAGAFVKIGTPICIEQNYPAIWNAMVNAGANCFVQLSYESWWNLEYFKRQMAGITRLRAIETRRCIARCSNSGESMFIDKFGRIIQKAELRECSLTSNLELNNELTFFSKHQLAFPLICLIFITCLSAYQIIKRTINKFS